MPAALANRRLLAHQMTMQRTHVFGYGSLVNRRTHCYKDTVPVRINGWQRAWRATHVRRLSFLTAIPTPGHALPGLIAAVPNTDWAALDAREGAYRMHPISTAGDHMPDPSAAVAIYAVPQGSHTAPTPENPVLLSYVDTVVQGYLVEFGIEGAEDFFMNTDGWADLQVIDDRASPIYGRHQVLTDTERGVVDDGLHRARARVIVS